ncbi:hypothetical protein Tco_0252384, partial [Tanacetum coccineum]
FSNKEGKIKTGSTRNCGVNVAVVAVVTVCMLLVLVFPAAIQMMKKLHVMGDIAQRRRLGALL